MINEINEIAETEKEHSRLAEQSVRRDPDSSIDLEPNINLERQFDALRKRRHLEQQCRELIEKCIN